MKTATDIKNDALLAWYFSLDDRRKAEETGSMLFLLAAITSADKLTRELAKKSIRERVAAGLAIIKARDDATSLATFANRHEP